MNIKEKAANLTHSWVNVTDKIMLHFIVIEQCLPLNISYE